MFSSKGAEKILETMKEHSHSINAVQWSNDGLRFASGDDGGKVVLWRLEGRRWTGTHLKWPSEGRPSKVKVNILHWSCHDRWIVAAFGDSSIKVWDSVAGC